MKFCGFCKNILQIKAALITLQIVGWVVQGGQIKLNIGLKICQIIKPFALKKELNFHNLVP